MTVRRRTEKHGSTALRRPVVVPSHETRCDARVPSATVTAAATATARAEYTRPVRFVLVLLLVGCASYPPVVVRAAEDLQCPEDEIETRDLGSGGWQVKGCGQLAVYDCQASEDGARTICVKQ